MRSSTPLSQIRNAQIPALVPLGNNWTKLRLECNVHAPCVRLERPEGLMRTYNPILGIAAR